MSHKVHQGTDTYEWDVAKRTRMGRYKTATVLEHIDTAMRDIRARNILDLGCGTGKISFHLMNRGFEVISLEYDFQPLQWFRYQASEARLTHANAERLPFAGISFDCILAIEVLDYLYNRPQFYRDAWRTLRSGGLLLATLTNKHSIKGTIYDLYLHWHRRQRSARFYEMDYTEGIAEITTAGFEIINTWGYNWNLLPRKADNLLVDIFATTERILGLNNWPALSPTVFVVARKAD